MFLDVFINLLCNKMVIIKTTVDVHKCKKNYRVLREEIIVLRNVRNLGDGVTKCFWRALEDRLYHALQTLDMKRRGFTRF